MPSEKKPNLFSRFLDATDPERDVKLLGFGLVVVASIYWLTREQCRGEITGQWVDAFYGLCALVGLGGSAWAWVDNMRSKKTNEKDKEPK